MKDAAVFPMLSKKVTSLEGGEKQGSLLAGEELYATAKKAWDSNDLSVLTRTYVHHHQLVLQVPRYNGGTEFLSPNGMMGKASFALLNLKTTMIQCKIELLDEIIC